MRAIFVGPFGLRVKGTARARMLPLARALANKGWEVKALLPPWDSPQDSGRTWREQGVTVSHIHLPARAPLFRHLLIAWRLAGACRDFSPDVVHFFKPTGYPGLTAMLLWSLKKTGLFRARLIVDADDWEGKGGWSDHLPYPPHWRVFIPFQEKWVLGHCDAVTVASRALQTIVWSLGVPPRRVLYLPNGVEEPAHTSSPKGTAKTFVLYTRFVEFGLDRMVRIWAGIADEIPEARLAVIGRGFNGEEESFLRMVEDAGLGDTVSCLGWLEPDEIRRLLGEAWAALWPSDDNLINRAKCSAKLAELASLGIPTVAEDVGENRLYVPPELLVPSGDNTSFVEKATALARDESFRQEMSRKARARVIPHLVWDNLADALMRFYGESEE